MALFNFENAIEDLAAMGVDEVLLPFILIFTIVYAILQKVKILGDNKNFNTLIALVLSLLTIFPHVTGVGPDVIGLINGAIPNVSAWMVGIIMLLILMGAFGLNYKGSGMLNAIIVIGCILIVTYIFLGAATVEGTFSFLDETTKSALLVIIIFGLIVWFITGEKKSDGGMWNKIWKEFKEGIEKK